MFRIGLISDTHGLLRPQALEFLRGSDRIVHAGDIGNAEILNRLQELAALTVVRGNNDSAPWAQGIPETARVQVGEISLYVLHDVQRLAIDAKAANVDVVIAGHSHKPRVERRDGVLFVNPGSAGPRRFKLPVAAGELRIDGRRVEARWIELETPDANARGERRSG